MCQPTSVWDVICSGTTASGVPRDLGSTFPALSWHCVCTYPVSTPFPTCFHAFSSKLYSFYFLQSFLLNVFFSSPFYCQIFLTSCLCKLSQIFSAELHSSLLSSEPKLQKQGRRFSFLVSEVWC